MTTTVRLPHRVEQALATYCVEAKRTKSEVIVELLEQRFMGTQTERTPYELAREAGFIGCVAGKGGPCWSIPARWWRWRTNATAPTLTASPFSKTIAAAW